MRIDIDDADWDDDQCLTHAGTRFTGEVVETDRAGRVIALTNYVDGREHGPDWEWYPDGQLKATGEASDGLAVGLAREWHPNGQLAVEKTFSDAGDLTSIRRWSETGELIEQKEYRPV